MPEVPRQCRTRVGAWVDALLGVAGFARRRVLGGMPASYRPLVTGAQLWVPLPMDPDSDAFQGLYGLGVVARLAPGATVQQASAEVRGLVPEFTDRYPIQFREERISPVDVVPLLDTIVGDVRRTLVLTLVGVAPSWVPARRAAALDPVEALRAE